jgi:hypothetical protein
MRKLPGLAAGGGVRGVSEVVVLVVVVAVGTEAARVRNERRERREWSCILRSWDAGYVGNVLERGCWLRYVCSVVSCRGNTYFSTSLSGLN